MLSHMNLALVQQPRADSDSYSFEAGAEAEQPNPALRTRVCRHFLAGRCTWGDSCRFAHEPPQLSADSATAIRVGAAALPAMTLSNTATPTKKATEVKPSEQQRERSAAEAAGVCRHFLAGRCTWGDSCRFSHVMPVSLAAPKPIVQQPSDDFECSTPRQAPPPAMLRCFDASSSSQITNGAVSGSTPLHEGPKFPECPSPARTPTRYSHNPYAVTPPPLSMSSTAPSATTSPATFHRGHSMGPLDVNGSMMEPLSHSYNSAYNA